MKWRWERIPDGDNGKRVLIGGSGRQLEVWIDRDALCLNEDARFPNGEYSIPLEDIDWLRGLT